MKTKDNQVIVHLPSIVGKHYGEFWRFKGRYKAIKGSRASKKSSTQSLKVITEIIENPNINWLVVRKVERTLRDSCYAQLKWAIHRLKVDNFFKCSTSPLEITYKPTGQKILFRGLDDPLKVTSITVEVGSLCRLWIEEAYEITSEDAFDRLDESIRGQLPKGMYHQVVLTFNPWSDRHWLKKRFFDEPSKNVLAMTTNYMCNEFLSEADLILFEEMKKNPRRYRTAGLGEWGIVEGLVYENWEERVFDVHEISIRPSVRSAFGMDFGYVNDPSTLFCGLVDTVAREIYVFDEMYEKGMSNEDILSKVSEMGYSKERIKADSAEPKSIAYLRKAGLTRIRAAKKGPDSIRAGISIIQDYKIIIHPRCVNFITEISNYTWDKDKFDNAINKPIDDFNHLMDAMRYAMEEFDGRKGVRILK
ncbi:PBSX family phage terminase large subunit [uncultured Veillonella sp.]|uniref:PBSX family phage terminase large subunit n=1 Tax=uncultured Veillonella sp. TaxID=159268 RepID=UPI00265F6161|nr:PBSX family phage terminase large subunit [uncultured Veillonella sp.]